MIPEPKLKGLYQEVILDHNKNPRNFKSLQDATQYSHGHNPLCGDDYHIYLKIKDGAVVDVGFEGKGCAISKSSASIMTTLIKNKPLESVKVLKDDFISMMTAESLSGFDLKKVDRMAIFEGVRDFPIRVKCATLAWHALADALKDV